MSTDNTNAALAADTATPEVVRPKISDYRRHLLICTGPRCAPDGAAQDLFDILFGIVSGIANAFFSLFQWLFPGSAVESGSKLL